MTPSDAAPRKPRSPNCARRATKRPSAATPVGPAGRDLRFRAVDHPRDPEAVGAHAEALRPERLLERHADRALLGERLEYALGVGRLVHSHHHVESLRRLVAVRGRIAAEDHLLTDLQPRMDDLVAHGG